LPADHYRDRDKNLLYDENQAEEENGPKPGKKETLASSHLAGTSKTVSLHPSTNAIAVLPDFHPA